jgi:hypothetical protein
VHSTIVDLGALRLHLYEKGDFEKTVVLDLRETLGRGRSLRRLSSLFTSRAVDRSGRAH